MEHNCDSPCRRFKGSAIFRCLAPSFILSDGSCPIGIALFSFRWQIPSLTTPNLDSFPHAGRGVDPLPCDIPHRKIPLQLGIAVQQDGFIDDCFLQAKGSLRRTMAYMFKREHCPDMMLFAVRISNKINKNCINQEIVLSL